MAHDLAAHRLLLVAEYASTRARTFERLVFADFWRSERTITCSAPVDTTLQAILLQARLDLDRAVSAVRADLLAGVGEVEHIVQLLTVVHGRVRRIVLRCLGADTIVGSMIWPPRAI